MVANGNYTITINHKRSHLQTSKCTMREGELGQFSAHILSFSAQKQSCNKTKLLRLTRTQETDPEHRMVIIISFQ